MFILVPVKNFVALFQNIFSIIFDDHIRFLHNEKEKN